MIALIALNTKTAVHLGNYSVITSSLLLMPYHKKNSLHFLDDGCFPSLSFRKVDSWLVVCLVKKEQLDTFSGQEHQNMSLQISSRYKLMIGPALGGAGVVSFWRRQRHKLCRDAVRLLFPLRGNSQWLPPFPQLV